MIIGYIAHGEALSTLYNPYVARGEEILESQGILLGEARCGELHMGVHLLAKEGELGRMFIDGNRFQIVF